MAELTTEQLKKLPDNVFGLPETRQYPMPDRSHAANAKARAKQMLDAGKLSQADYSKIVAMADKMLNRNDGLTRYDAVQIAKARVDDDGFLHDTPVLTKTGVFVYRNPDGSTRREYRPPDEVFNADSLASYRGKPITIRHPTAGEVTPKTVRGLSVGTIMSEGRKDGDNVVGDIVIQDPSAIGNYRELSLGYRLDVEYNPGVVPSTGEPYDYIQRNIKINHLAVVPAARAGRDARLNLDGDEISEYESEGKKRMEKIRVDGIEYEAAPEVINFLKKETSRADAAETKGTELQKRLDGVTAERDGLKVKVDAFPAELEKVRKDGADKLNAAVKDRVELLQTAEKFNIDKADEMPDKDIKIAVIKAVRGDEFDAKDKSDDYVNAAFDFAKSDKRADNMANHRKATNPAPGKKNNDAEDGSCNAARQKYNDRLQNAWKGEDKGGK